MPLKIVRNDITKMQCDAIVNTVLSETVSRVRSARGKSAAAAFEENEEWARPIREDYQKRTR